MTPAQRRAPSHHRKSDALPVPRLYRPLYWQTCSFSYAPLINKKPACGTQLSYTEPFMHTTTHENEKPVPERNFIRFRFSIKRFQTILSCVSVLSDNRFSILPTPKRRLLHHIVPERFYFFVTARIMHEIYYSRSRNLFLRIFP